MADTVVDWTGTALPGRAVRITALDRAMLLDDLDRHLAAGRGFALATLNLDHIVKLRASADFRDAYLAHSHVTADGRPIAWLSRLAGRPAALIPGSDLVAPATALAARRDVPVAFIGSTEAALDAAAARLERETPGLRVVLRIAPPMDFDPRGETADRIIDRVARSGAGLCLLALGAPKQEMFAARAARALPRTGFLSIGAGLDFVAGHQARAPRIVRALAAEWLWRLASNPGRLAGRYAACFRILPGLVRDARRERRSGGAVP